MDPVTLVSIVYALVNIGASWCLNHRVRLGPYLGMCGAVLGFTTGLLSQDAKGLMINTPFYFVFGIMSLRSGRWDGQPWFRHAEVDDEG